MAVDFSSRYTIPLQTVYNRFILKPWQELD